MTETLAHGYSSESTQRELFYEYEGWFSIFFTSCALDESTPSIGRFKRIQEIFKIIMNIDPFGWGGGGGRIMGPVPRRFSK